MCDLYPVFKSCCGVSVRIAMLYIAILSIVTGALINAALKKAGVEIASIEAVKELGEDGDSLYEARRDTDDGGFRRFGKHSVDRAAREETKTESGKEGGDDEGGDNEGGDDEGGDNEGGDNEGGDNEGGEDDYQLEDESTTAAATTTTATTLSFMEKVSLVNRNGMNLLASAYICLGVLLLVANFMRSPELALVSVAAGVGVAAASLVLLAGVVGECAKKRTTCLLNKLDWFSSFIVTLVWFMYVFCWLFFAGVTNAFANGLY